MMALLSLLVLFFLFHSDKITFFISFLLSYASLVSVIFIFNGTPWFGLIFFLIYVSGLLVLFGYTMAMSPNVITPPITYKYMPLSLLLLIPNTKTINMEVMKIMYFHDIVDIFNYHNLSLYLIMTIMLFLSLLAVVNITYKAPSPLRPYF
uniref:NADH dehydrogenase subunit 6 n=1 Tax=Celleporella hyalina TaxID=60593 RepID=I6PZT9_9BILA|nr:NADH dehydrogenase subunit 6 [Celleporella hyalina]